MSTTGVGKTSLVVRYAFLIFCRSSKFRCMSLTSPENRYVKNTFDAASASTIGASFLAKKVVVDDCLVRLQVSFLTDHLVPCHLESS